MFFYDQNAKLVDDFKNYKEKTLHVICAQVAMYARETWSTTKGDEKKLLICKRKVLQKIHGSI